MFIYMVIEFLSWWLYLKWDNSWVYRNISMPLKQGLSRRSKVDLASWNLLSLSNTDIVLKLLKQLFYSTFTRSNNLPAFNPCTPFILLQSKFMYWSHLLHKDFPLNSLVISSFLDHAHDHTVSCNILHL